ncbi:MAG: FMN-dependent NADH-azoreductase [Curvibacter sp.]|nr:MAG: FMN-dependent NADH-azoreductase [Curvibacter sp.]
MASTTLVIKSSPSGERSVSRLLLDDLLRQRSTTHPGEHVVTRDLVAMGAALPHVDSVFAQAIFIPPSERSAEQQRGLKLSDELADELLAAQTIIIATPMYNRTVPSSLKAWIDHIVRPGLTFTYDEEGRKGLLAGKKAILLCATGGVYSTGAGTAEDFLVPYLQCILEFMGITDVEVYRAEGLVQDYEGAVKNARGILAAANGKA